ncbi:hypothetical protein MM213_14255 [Belliella sp. R4-6]|uniref:Curlin associated repeat-containing protein n=1 Tax=Belliella alkalica TaxID=1730871 RepID=A0ABS9VDY8_9BACT|nr:hypothetical protein [Belliella alkalica]MCH7414659.1 hypothetical protein [Belliella alkalica]
MNFKNYILLSIAFSLPILLYGQEVVEVNLSGELKELLNSQNLNIENESNVSVIKQVGNQNESRIIQDLNSNQSNISGINQNGSLNYGYVEQTGYSLRSFINQSGNRNQSNLWSKGDQISISVDQQGDKNVVNTYIENAGIMSRTALLSQLGSENIIELVLVGNNISTTLGSQPINISQFGNQNNVTAVMENFGSPIEITQTPGAGGQGMSVNVSNSAFSFPGRR